MQAIDDPVYREAFFQGAVSSKGWIPVKVQPKTPANSASMRSAMKSGGRKTEGNYVLASSNGGGGGGDSGNYGGNSTSSSNAVGQHHVPRNISAPGNLFFNTGGGNYNAAQNLEKSNRDVQERRVTLEGDSNSNRMSLGNRLAGQNGNGNNQSMREDQSKLNRLSNLSRISFAERHSLPEGRPSFTGDTGEILGEAINGNINGHQNLLDQNRSDYTGGAASAVIDPLDEAHLIEDESDQMCSAIKQYNRNSLTGDGPGGPGNASQSGNLNQSANRNGSVDRRIYTNSAADGGGGGTAQRLLLSGNYRGDLSALRGNNYRGDLSALRCNDNVSNRVPNSAGFDSNPGGLTLSQNPRPSLGRKRGYYDDDRHDAGGSGNFANEGQLDAIREENSADMSRSGKRNGSASANRNRYGSIVPDENSPRFRDVGTAGGVKDHLGQGQAYQQQQQQQQQFPPQQDQHRRSSILKNHNTNPTSVIKNKDHQQSNYLRLSSTKRRKLGSLLEKVCTSPDVRDDDIVYDLDQENIFPNQQLQNAQVRHKSVRIVSPVKSGGVSNNSGSKKFGGNFGVTNYGNQSTNRYNDGIIDHTPGSTLRSGRKINYNDGGVSLYGGSYGGGYNNMSGVSGGAAGGGNTLGENLENRSRSRSTRRETFGKAVDNIISRRGSILAGRSFGILVKFWFVLICDFFG